MTTDAGAISGPSAARPAPMAVSLSPAESRFLQGASDLETVHKCCKHIAQGLHFLAVHGRRPVERSDILNHFFVKAVIRTEKLLLRSTGLAAPGHQDSSVQRALAGRLDPEAVAAFCVQAGISPFPSLHEAVFQCGLTLMMVALDPPQRAGHLSLDSQLARLRDVHWEKVSTWLITELARSTPEPAPAPIRTSRRRRRPSVKQERPLTEVERRTIEVVGDHGGNIAAAARELRKDRKTVEENLRRGRAKLGSAVGSRSVGAGRLQSDRRGNLIHRTRPEE